MFTKMRMWAIGLLLAAVLLVEVLPMPAFAAASGSCGTNLTWTLDDAGKLTISGSGAMTSSPWYNYYNSIKTVSIGSSVTSICDYAFSSCYNLTNVTIGSSVKTIGLGAFGSCSKLTSVTIPASVTSIGDGAFTGCSAMTTITVNSSNKYYSSSGGVLFNKAKTTLIAAPGAFSGSYTVPSTVTSISSHAFYGTKITDITIPNSVTEINESAFMYCRQLENVTLGTGLTYIGTRAFSGCYALQNPTFPNSLKTIGYYAFEDCRNLTEITIPKNVSDIGIAVFGGCSKLQRITVEAGNSYYSSDENGVLFNKDKTKLVYVPYAVGVDDPIPDTVTTIGQYSLIDYARNKTVTIPAGVKTMETRVFWYNSGLKTVVFEGDAPTINGSAFEDVTVTAYYPGTKTTWTEEVRKQYGGTITWVLVYETVASGCCGDPYVNEGKDVTWTLDDAGVLTISGTGAMANFGSGEAPWYEHKDSITSVVMEEGVTSIGDFAFEDCSGLTGVTIPDSVTSIGDSVFENCTSLSSVSIPDSVTSIGNDAFSGCNRLEDVYFGGGKDAWEKLSVTFGDTTRGHWDVADSADHWTEDNKDPTCAENGYTREACACGYTRNESTAPATGNHVYDQKKAESAYLVSKATCTAAAVYKKSCGCGAAGQETFKHGEVLDHSYESAVTEPTCEDDGYTTYTCSACGDSYVADEVEASGHDYESAVTEPTCEDDGYTTYICSACGDSYVADEVKTPGHSYEGVVTDPTCEDGGYTTYTCSGCSDSYVADEEEASGHDYESVITEPTCENDGYTAYTCTVCGDSYVADEVEASGHSYEKGSCTVCGEADPDYTIVTGVTRLSGKGRCETAFLAADELKAVLGVEKFDAVIIASGDNFADALAGSYLAAVKNAPILLYRGGYEDENAAYIAANLKEGGKVYILGGNAAVPQEMADALTGCDVQRIKGANRFETNLAILKEAGVGKKDILVATGYNFADSLSASATGMPILLVHNSNSDLTDSQKAFLDELDGNKIVVIGGEGAVNDALFDALGAYGYAERVKGAGREATSVAIAEKYFEAPDAAVLAYSRNFPDGLCGGPLAYAMGAPLLLTNTGYAETTGAYTIARGITDGYVLGGTKAVSDIIVRTVFDMAKDAQITVKR